MNNRNRKIERGEVFVEVEGFGNRYEISNRGRLWSNVRNKYLGSKNKETGYIHATLHNEKGEQFTAYIHRLVGEAFIPNDDPENKTEINHKNYRRYDNRVENLEWVSPQENIDYSYDNKLEGIKKKWEDPEFREKMKEELKERNQDPEFRERHKEGLKKIWEDEDFRKRQAEGTKKKWEDPEFRKKKQKPVEQYNIDGELVSRFSSGIEAAEKTGIKQSSISNALKGRYKTAGGYKWKYKEE